jgi:hypothetical protein
MFETYIDPETGTEYWWCVDCGNEFYADDIVEIVDANGAFTGQCLGCIQDEHDKRSK